MEKIGAQTTTYENANHAPVVKLNHLNRVVVKPNTAVKLSGQATDPDGDGSMYRWWQYKEVGTLRTTYQFQMLKR